jgi:hypothetical protein
VSECASSSLVGQLLPEWHFVILWSSCYFLKGQSSNFTFKKKSIFESLYTVKSHAQHVTHFYLYRRHKLTDGIKKQTAGNLRDQNLNFDSSKCHSKNR